MKSVKGKVNFFGIIPARGGSKGIPNKNLANLGGKPLIAYTIDSCLQSKFLDYFVVSTDDEKIQETSLKLGADVPFLRPAKLSDDVAPASVVIKHALEWFNHCHGYLPSQTVYLQPTSPLRTASHIDEAIKIFSNAERKLDALTSVTKVPHNFAIEKQLLLEEGLLVNVHDRLDPARRQEAATRFARNGPAILILNTQYFLAGMSFYSGKTGYFEMSKLTSIDIDDPDDLALCEAIISR